MTYSSDPITRGELASVIRDVLAPRTELDTRRVLSAIARRLESPVATASVCSSIQSGSGVFCAKCKISWDYGDERPPCPIDTP
jgi:hypothetical protein